jgi:taurine transport system substrate-binding protein
MKEHGNVLLTGADKEALGIKVFDATVIPPSFGEEHPDLVTKFVAVTAKMNAQYAADPNAMISTIAEEAGMDEAATVATLTGVVFPTVDEQMGPAWFGGGPQTFLKEVGDFVVEQGTIPAARDSYEGAANGSFLEAASKM